jgi:hypothetical protein
MQVIIVDWDDKMDMIKRVIKAIDHIREVAKLKKEDLEKEEISLLLQKRRFWRKFNPFLKKLDENNLKEYLLRKMERRMNDTSFNSLRNQYFQCFGRDFFQEEIRKLEEIQKHIHYGLRLGLDIAFEREETKFIEQMLSLSWI